MISSRYLKERILSSLLIVATTASVILVPMVPLESELSFQQPIQIDEQENCITSLVANVAKEPKKTGIGFSWCVGRLGGSMPGVNHSIRLLFLPDNPSFTSRLLYTQTTSSFL